MFRLLAATVLLLGTTSDALARDNHALLIGASTYPNLEERFWLRGPKNDITLVQSYLTQHAPVSFAPENVLVLADGLDGHSAPTLAAIRDAVATLTTRVNEGDFVYLHFSGHGSQAPALDPASELDGLDELFLPVDIGPWNDTVGTVENALLDDEIGTMLDGLRAKGADVWVVFDSCHSGTATRAAPSGQGDIRQRQLPSAALRIPDAALAAAETRSRALPNANTDPRRPASAPIETTAQSGSLVAFFAAQTNETTPERNMPRSSLERQLQGVFTYTLFETLAERPGISYRQLGQEVLRKYATGNLAGSTPMFEGDLDRPVFAAGTQAAGTRLLQWPVTAQKDQLRLSAGQLHGLHPGTNLLLLASPADPDDSALATYEVRKSTAFSAVAALKSADKGENTASSPPKLPKGAVLRLAAKPLDLTLTVARPPAGSAPADALNAALAIIARDGLLGPRLRFVAPAEDADLRLMHLPDSARPDALWLLPNSALSADALQRQPSISTRDKTALELADALTEILSQIAKATNLMRLGATTAGSTIEVDAQLTTARFDPDLEEVIEASRALPAQHTVPRMIPNDVIGLNLHNPTDRPVDFNILYVGADYAITFMGNGRLQPGDRLQEDFVLVTDESFGRDRMIVIVTPGAKQTTIEDLSFLEQSPVTRTRAVAASPAEGLRGLLDEAGFGQTTRAAISLSKRKKQAVPTPLFLQFDIDTIPGINTSQNN